MPDDLDYVWPSPDGDGWVDAWNGWYETEAQAREDGAAGVGRPWVLRHGEGIITEDEMEARRVTADALECGAMLYDHTESGDAVCTQPKGTEHDHAMTAAEAIEAGLARSPRREEYEATITAHVPRHGNFTASPSAVSKVHHEFLTAGRHGGLRVDPSTLAEVIAERGYGGDWDERVFWGQQPFLVRCIVLASFEESAR